MELHDILLAADVVENKFPPKTLEDVMSLVASLNLLNAAVKTPIGTSTNEKPQRYCFYVDPANRMCKFNNI